METNDALTACIGRSGTCKNNGQFDGLCFFCRTNNEITRTAAPLDSAAIDNRLLCATNEWLNGKIRDATWQLKRALSLPQGVRRDVHLNLALKALGGLGAS
jgi:hypothetical protein